MIKKFPSRTRIKTNLYLDYGKFQAKGLQDLEGLIFLKWA